MKRTGIFLSFAWAALSAVAGGSPEPRTDGEKWNAGIAHYLDGDVTNALNVCEQLMRESKSRALQTKAAKIVTKIEYDRGRREAAANAAQFALRSAPNDEQTIHNFALATDGLLEFREEKHATDVLEKSKGKELKMLQDATHEARKLLKGYVAMATNSPAKAVEMSDDFVKRSRTLADVWIPVRQVIEQRMTNEAQKATVQAQIDDARRKTKEAATAFEDMSENAYSDLAYAEQDLTRFLKAVAYPPMAMEEDELAQTNAWQDIEKKINGRSWQQDALDYTESFIEQFPTWAQEYEQKRQSDTNMPPFTAEDQEKVSALATELKKLQQECVEKNLPPKQEQALGVIRQIRELLPKENNGGGQGQQNQNQNQQQNKDQQKQDQNQQQQSQNQQNQQDQTQDQDPQQQEDKESEVQESDEKPEDKEVEAVLKKAQERNDEHEAEKKARMRKAPLPPNARDW